MRIVLVGSGMLPIPPVDYGAVEKHIWNLSQALQKRGHHVRIVNKVVGPHSKDEYRFAFWAKKEVTREPWDILHLHTPGVASIFSALGPRRFDAAQPRQRGRGEGRAVDVAHHPGQIADLPAAIENAGLFLAGWSIA